MLPQKDGNEMVFENVGSQKGFTLETQELDLEDFGKEEIMGCLQEMFVIPGEFVVLTAPEAQHKVRYVQACMDDDGVEVELGIEGEGTRLYYKICSEEECSSIFFAFYGNTFVPNMEEYKPVEI